MPDPTQIRPTAAETSDYFRRYVDQVPEGDVVDLLRAQHAETLALLAGVSEERAEHRYAPGKWSIKELVGHLTDTEWIFTYRALRFARGDRTELPGVEQDDLVAGTDFSVRTLASLVEEWKHMRAANTALFASFDAAVLGRGGVASGSDFTVRSVLYVIAGHELHHRRVLQERYL